MSLTAPPNGHVLNPSLMSSSTMVPGGPLYVESSVQVPPIVELVDVGTDTHHRLVPGDTVTFGSDPNVNTIALYDPLVSRKHAVLTWQGREAFLHDACSKNGTRVNGRRIERCQLTDGNVIQFGNIRLVALAEPVARRRHPPRWHVGQSPAYVAAVREAIEAVSAGPGVRLAGEQGVGRAHLACVIHDVVCGVGAPWQAIDLSDDRAPPWHRVGLHWNAAGAKFSGLTYFHGLNRASSATPSSAVALEATTWACEGGPKVVVASAGGRDHPLLSHLPLVRVPSLSERQGDLELLIDHFCGRFLHAGATGRDLPADVFAALMRHRWPGNVTEIYQAVQRIGLVRRMGDLARAADELLHLNEESHDGMRVLSIDRRCTVGMVSAMTADELGAWLEARGIIFNLLC